MRRAALALLLLSACTGDPCHHDLYQFCARSSADCRPYDTRVAALHALPSCSCPGFGVVIELRTCNGRHFLSENDGFGGAEYAYDDIGKLVGVTTGGDQPFACGELEETFGAAAHCDGAVEESIRVSDALVCRCTP